MCIILPSYLKRKNHYQLEKKSENVSNVTQTDNICLELDY